MDHRSAICCRYECTNIGTFTYNPTTTGALSQYLVITYPNALSSSSRLVALGLVDYELRFTSSSFYFTLENTGLTNTAFQVQMNTTMAEDLRVLKVSYLTVDSTFTSPFSISHFTSVIVY